ncbi:MAG TPA: MerR family transcriptional regulator [Isosphaeraceae bacterium]|jgi:DNA-binding transcriptional MerR regulator|nr:MerR family transcriptional regulator [Isosphaeraceae bacterium]
MKPCNEPHWTIDELGKRTADALAVDYEGPPNDRVREIPDRRTIRYYTTLGLIDRPAAMRGRTALYGRRHLLQLVAIKRLQAKGLSLAEVQGHLLGMTDGALAKVARLPERIEHAASSLAPKARSEPETVSSAMRSERFWRAEPAPVLSEVRDGRKRAEAGSSALANPAFQALPLQGISLLPGATLLLASGRTFNREDLEAIRKTAGPLIELLQTRRLIGPREEGVTR